MRSGATGVRHAAWTHEVPSGPLAAASDRLPAGTQVLVSSRDMGAGRRLVTGRGERSEGRGRRRRGRVRGQQLRKPSLPAVGPQTCFLSPSWEPDIRGHSVTRRALLPLLAPGLSRCPQARGQAPRMSASHHGASPRVCVPKSPSRGHGCGTRATLPPCDLMRNQSHPRRPFPSEVPFQLLGGRDLREAVLPLRLSFASGPPSRVQSLDGLKPRAPWWSRRGPGRCGPRWRGR